MDERVVNCGHAHKQPSVFKRVIEGVVITLLTGGLVGLTVTIVKRPKVQISLEPPSLKVLRGDKVRISWKVENADDIELSLGTHKIKVASEGSRVETITQPTTVRVTATSGWLKAIFAGADVFYAALDEKPIEILSPPKVKMWAEPAEVLRGEYTTVKWLANDADTVFIKGIESGQLAVEQNGSRQVKIDNTKTFQIVGLNRAGESTDTFTVRGRIPEPKATISANSTEIPVGNNVVISWNCENADSVILKGVETGPIAVDPSGSRQIQINESKTFEIVAINQIGKARQSLTVNVYVPELTVSISINPSTTVVGGYATLTWDSENAQYLSINEFGEVPAKGSRQIQVTSSKTYEVVATSDVGTKRATATVNVRLPRVSLIPLGHLSDSFKQTIDPSLESFFRARGFDVTYNSVQSGLNTNTNTDYIVEYQTTNPEWRSSRTATPVGSIDRNSVEVHITISLIRRMDNAKLSVEGKGTAAITGFQTSYVESSRSPRSTGKEIEATQKAVNDALKRFTIPASWTNRP